MADTKLSDVTLELSSPLLTDWLYAVDDPAGTPGTAYLPLGNIALGYAQIYCLNGVGSQTPGASYTKLTQWTANGRSLYATPDYTNSRIAITNTGHYAALFWASFGVGATSSFDAYFQIYWNGAAVSYCPPAIVADTVGHALTAGIIYATAASTYVEVYVKTSVASKDIDIEQSALVLMRLGPT